MATLSRPLYYENGVSGASHKIGYDNGTNRVVRFEFTTGSSGATNISLNISAGSIYGVNGTPLNVIPFCITTSNTSHANANSSSGSSVTGYISGSSGNAYTGSANIILLANTTYYIWFFPYSKSQGWSTWDNNGSHVSSYTLSGTSKYTLSITSGQHSGVSVYRTSSQSGMPSMSLEDGDAIYTGDKIRISFFTDDDLYSISTHTVNGSVFTSGNTHSVSGNVSIVSNAIYSYQATLFAGGGYIGGEALIQVQKNNSNNWISLQYEFGSLSGYINSDGTVSDTESRYRDQRIRFVIPDSVYTQIPNDRQAHGSITCKVYDSSTSQEQLGQDIVEQITAYVNASECTPSISGSVTDVNPDTLYFTGDEQKLVKYVSTARCLIESVPKKSATITNLKIYNTDVHVNYSQSTNTYYGTRDFENASLSSYLFDAYDSREFWSSVTIPVNSNMIQYIPITCNPELYRQSSSNNVIFMKVNGNYFNQSFGLRNNSLMLSYRYREATNSTFGSWISIDTSSIETTTSSYSNTTGIQLGDTFDYRKAYVFEIRASDGNQSHVLTTDIKTVNVQSGEPLFDWGSDNFCFNIPVKFMSNIILSCGDQLNAGDNLNDFKTGGIFYTRAGTESSMITNAPSASAGFRLFVVDMGPGSSIVHNIKQIADMKNTSCEKYERFYNGSSWGQWNKVQ